MSGSAAPARATDREITDALARALRSTYEHRTTQAAIAEALGVDQPKVSKWVRGETRVPLWAIPAIEQLCDRPVGSILRMSGLVEDDMDTLTAIISDVGLSPDQRDALVRVYEVFRAGSAEGRHPQRLGPPPAPAVGPSAGDWDAGRSA